MPRSRPAMSDKEPIDSMWATFNRREAAQAALPIIRDHLKMAEQLRDAFKGS